MTTFTVNLLPNFWSFGSSPLFVSCFHSGAKSHSLECSFFCFSPTIRFGDIKHPSSSFFSLWSRGSYRSVVEFLTLQSPYEYQSITVCWGMLKVCRILHESLVEAFSSCHNVSHCVWPGKRKLECMFWLAETLEYSESLLMVYIVFPTVTLFFLSFVFLHPFSRR